MSVLLLDEHADFDLVLGMRFGLEAADDDLVDVVKTHFEHREDVMVAAPGDISQETVTIEDGHRFGVVPVLPVEDEVQPGADFQVAEYLAALIVLETGDVERLVVRFVHLGDFFLLHSALH